MKRHLARLIALFLIGLLVPCLPALAQEEATIPEVTTQAFTIPDRKSVV